MSRALCICREKVLARENDTKNGNKERPPASIGTVQIRTQSLPVTPIGYSITEKLRLSDLAWSIKLSFSVRKFNPYGLEVQRDVLLIGISMLTPLQSAYVKLTKSWMGEAARPLSQPGHLRSTTSPAALP